MRWQEIVVIPEIEEDVTCDCCSQPARSVEGRLVHREEPLGRFTVRWRPGVPDHPARHVLYLGDWNRRGGMDDGPAVAAAYQITKTNARVALNATTVLLAGEQEVKGFEVSAFTKATFSS